MKSNATVTEAPRGVSPVMFIPVAAPILIALLLNMPRIIGSGPVWAKFLNDTTLLNLTLLFYLFASVLFMFYAFQKEEDFMRIGSFLSIAGFTFHSTSFILRWIEVGRPPYGGINEVVLSFAWSLVLLNLIIVHTSKFRMMNLFSLPLATVAAFLATIFPTERTGFLVPALQSYWLYIHVSMAMFSYPTFGLAFVVALLYLIKDRVRPESFGAFIAAISLLIYLFIDKINFSWITNMQYYLSGFADGREILIAEDTPLKVPIPYVAWVFLAILVSSFIAFSMYLVALYKDPRYGKTAFKVTTVNLVLQILGLALLSSYIVTTPRVSFSSNPFALTGIVFSLMATALLWLITAKQESIIKILPDTERLDHLIYKIITVGVPLLALQLITGAMWAGESWGRYWGWDPKETWALITWLIYVAYLHAKMSRGWTGRKNVYFAIIGFASVLFTYLGVTYLLSGLHSYK